MHLVQRALGLYELQDQDQDQDLDQDQDQDQILREEFSWWKPAPRGFTASGQRVFVLFLAFEACGHHILKELALDVIAQYGFMCAEELSAKSEVNLTLSLSLTLTLSP